MTTLAIRKEPSMLTMGWLVAAAVVLATGTALCVAIARAATRRRRSRNLAARERQRWLMRYDRGPTFTGSGQHAAALPRCPECGDVLREIDALQDHLRLKHSKAA